MSRLNLKTTDFTQVTIERLRSLAEQRLGSNPSGICPVDLALNIIRLCQMQTCGKCAPCRIGLEQLATLLEQILNEKAVPNTLELIEQTAKVVSETADCAIGEEAAKMVLIGLHGFRSDYESHIKTGRCSSVLKASVPCVHLCPANVDVPGYIALIRSGRNADAVRLIRKDNPFPSVCGYICEHPCESKCRRGLVDSPLNIRGLKKYAVDNSKDVPQPQCAVATGKNVAIVGAGPSGLTAAYYLTLMGHSVTIYEKNEQLGGMLRYGIPDYRLPRDLLDAEIRSILQLGIKVKPQTEIGKDISFESLRKDYDALYVSMGAHTDKKLDIEGENALGVTSAVQLLRAVGDGNKPDYTGKRVVVIGGGNVAMDVTRSSIRFGASSVTCVYRRRREDMTALPEEVEGAIAEGAQIISLCAPVRIETDKNNVVTALWVQPQIIGLCDSQGRPSPLKANLPERRIPADIIIVAIGQNIETACLLEAGFKLTRRGTIQSENDTHIVDMPGVFVGGDCATGPTTVIRAIAAGKVAAANIDNYLGFRYEINLGVSLPPPQVYDINAQGRIEILERNPHERKNDFNCVEIGMTFQEALGEASRCLRCDCFGAGNFRGGREEKW